MTWWQILLLIYGAIVAFVNLVEFGWVSYNDGRWPLLETPKNFYEDYGMNWFGSIVSWFGEFLLNPIVWVVLLLSRAITWLFYAGRKN